MTFISDLLIIMGILFSFLGCLGVLRFFDLYSRLHSATLVSTWGTYFIMFGILLKSGINEIGIKAILVIFFMLVFSPTTSHLLARMSYLSGILPKQASIDELEDKSSQPTLTIEGENNEKRPFP